MALHRTLTAADGIHILQAYEYADEAERLAATGFTSADVGKVARQASDNSFWVLIVHSPATWTGLAGSGSIMPHAASHQDGGSDEVASGTPAAYEIPKADESGKLNIGWIPVGSTSGTVCAGDDSRLSNARTPTAHASSHEPGGSDAMMVDAAATIGSLRTIGTGALQACAGNDARLSNARTPTAHALSHEPGGSDAMTVDAAASVGSLRTLGTGAQQACAGNDSRLSDARTPTSHASSHAAGGADPLSPKEYGPLASDPSSPTPSDGDSYYNTTLKEVMRYDGSRSKWLSVKALTFLAGRNGNTATGSFYRGMDGLTFGAGIGYAVPKGTLVGLSWSKTNAGTASMEVLVGGSVIASLTLAGSGSASDWTLNADFSAGLLQFRNASAGSTTTDVQATAIIKRRA